MVFEINDWLKAEDHEPLATEEDLATFGLASWSVWRHPYYLLQVTIGDNWSMAAEKIIANFEGFYEGNVYKTIGGGYLENKDHN